MRRRGVGGYGGRAPVAGWPSPGPVPAETSRARQGQAPVRTAAVGWPPRGTPYAMGATVHAAGYSGEGGQVKGGLGDTVHGAGVQNP